MTGTCATRRRTTVCWARKRSSASSRWAGLTLEDVRRYFDPYDYVALAHYNDRPDERSYLFVVASQNEAIPTPLQRVRLWRQAGLATCPDEYPDRVFSCMILRVTRMMRDREGWASSAPASPHCEPTPPAVPAETTSVSMPISAVVEAEARL